MSPYEIFQKTRRLGKENTRNIFIAVAIIISFFFAKRITIYILFSGITAFIIYYTKLYHVPFDVSPLFFLEIVITRYYGLQWTLLFILIAYILPKTFAGTNMKFDSYVFISISLLANAFVLLFPGMPLMTAGFVTSILQYFGGILFSMTMMPPFMAAIDGIANVANNLIWFLIFSDAVVWLMV